MLLKPKMGEEIECPSCDNEDNLMVLKAKAAAKASKEEATRNKAAAKEEAARKTAEA